MEQQENPAKINSFFDLQNRIDELIEIKFQVIDSEISSRIDYFRGEIKRLGEVAEDLNGSLDVSRDDLALKNNLRQRAGIAEEQEKDLSNEIGAYAGDTMWMEDRIKEDIADIFALIRKEIDKQTQDQENPLLTDFDWFSKGDIATARIKRLIYRVHTLVGDELNKKGPGKMWSMSEELQVIRKLIRNVLLTLGEEEVCI